MVKRREGNGSGSFAVELNPPRFASPQRGLLSRPPSEVNPTEGGAPAEPPCVPFAPR